MVDATPQALAEWCNTLGPFLPAKTREGLRELVFQRNLDGYTFSVLVNQHNELTNMGVPQLTLAMATKIRKCWHRDFPQAASIRTPEAPLPSTRSSTMTVGEEERGVDLSRSGDSSRSGGLLHGASQWQSSSPGRPGLADHGVPPGAPAGGMGMHGMDTNGPRRASHTEAGTAELLRSALDCVAERAGLDRQEMYLWVHGVIPNEIWQPLWDGVTADLLRQQRPCPAAPHAMQTGRAAAHFPGHPALAVMQRALPEETTPLPPPVNVGRPGCSSKGSSNYSCDSPDLNAAAMPQRLKRPSYSEMSEDVISREHGQITAAALRVDAISTQEHMPQFSGPRGPFPGHRSPAAMLSPRAQLESPRCGGAPSEISFLAPTERSMAAQSEAETIASQAMSAWLETENGQNAPVLSPLEMAEWLRTLPSGRLPEEARKAVARRVLDEDIDSTRFGQSLEEGRWSELGVADERDAGMFLRFFKARQREAMMAEAAKQTAALNRSLKGMKGEMLTV